jgi:hypothetical protein
MPIDYIRMPREFYHNVLAYDTITTVGRFYAERHGNADVIRVLEWEAEYMHDDLNDPIHEVLRASFEDQDIPTDPLPPEIIDKLCRHTCGKKMASVCPVCLEFPKKGETVYKLRCKHYIHVDCAKGWFDVASTCPICTKNLNATNL